MLHNFNSPLCYDTIIIGGGIIGAAIAKTLQEKLPTLKIALLEKEDCVGQHQSSHNSQVVHAGIYYKPNSLKAKLCGEGAKRIYQYCVEKDISFKKCGKLIVACSPLDLIQMKVLYQTGKKNKVQELMILENWKDVLKIQPDCQGMQAIWSPNSGNVNFETITKHFVKDFVTAGGKVFLQTKAFKIKNSCESSYPLLIEVESKDKMFMSKAAILCTGFFSSNDLFENENTTDEKYKNVSFKVNYSILHPKLNSHIKTNIYALPHTSLPFLGIHLSPTVSGKVLVGPNAIPACNVDGYRYKPPKRYATKLIIFSSQDFDCDYMKNFIMSKHFQQMFLKNIPSCVDQVTQYLFKRKSSSVLAQYFPKILNYDIQPGLTAIQSQLLKENGDFMDDFLIEFFEGGGIKSRIINCRFIPSPGATSCIPLAELVCNKMKQEMFEEY